MQYPALLPLQEWLAQTFPHAHLLVVGGSVRDWVRGKPSKDLDLEVLGVELEELKAALPFQQRQVGKSFSHLLLKLEEFGWVEMSVEPEPVTGSLDAHWAKLTQRRDFTCNTLAWDPTENRLLDPLGGSADIRAGVLRQASPHSLQKDPLRVLRAAQFCARLGFRPEAGTDAALRKYGEALAGIAPERVTREWAKLLCMPEYPSAAIELLDEWGVVKMHYPELQKLHRVPQDPVYHPEGDVWVHTMLVTDQAALIARRDGIEDEARLQMMLGALLHDVGKPFTTKKRRGGRVSAYGHEKAGVPHAARWLSRMCFADATVQAALECVEHHMRPLLLLKDIQLKRLSPSQQVNALRRLLRDLQFVSWEVFIRVCEADKRGRGTVLATYEAGEVLQRLLDAHPIAEQARSGLLRGRDLLPLGIPAGPELGKWLRRVELARDEGVVASPEEALEWVRVQLVV